MSAQNAHHYEQIAQALRVNYLCLAMFDAVGKEFNISNRLDIPKAMSQAETRLEEYWRTGEINYVDIQPIMKTACQAAHELWMPEADTFTQRASVHAINMDARAWQHDAVIREEPYIQQPDKIVNFDEGLLSAYEIVRNRFDLGSPDSMARLDLKAISSALDARQSLASLRSESLQSRTPEKKDHTQLPSINSVTASYPSVSAWLHGIAAKDALPPAKKLKELLRANVSKDGDGVSTSWIKDASDQWAASLNNAPEEWAQNSINAVVDILASDRLADSRRTSAEVIADLASNAAATSGFQADEYAKLRNEVSTHRHMKAEIDKAREVSESIESAISLLRSSILSASSVKFGHNFEANSKAERQIASELDMAKEQLIKQLENLPENFEELIVNIVEAGVTPEDAHQYQNSTLKYG